MMHLRDRLQTIAATAIITSLGWITAGAVIWAGGNDRPSRQAGLTPAALRAGDRLIIPVQGVRANQLTDTFTQAREDGARVHDAIDIMAPRGTPVIAATGGQVEKLFTSKGGGLTVYVRSSDRRTIYYYAHLDSYSPGLTEKQPVARAQRLGAVGSTGNANPLAPHLHFAVLHTAPAAKWYEPNTAINPYPLLVH